MNKQCVVVVAMEFFLCGPERALVEAGWILQASSSSSKFTAQCSSKNSLKSLEQTVTQANVVAHRGICSGECLLVETFA